jgi:hypothetical protein
MISYHLYWLYDPNPSLVARSLSLLIATKCKYITGIVTTRETQPHIIPQPETKTKTPSSLEVLLAPNEVEAGL